MNIITPNYITHIHDGSVLNEKDSTLTLRNGKVLKVTFPKLSSWAEENLKNFWAVVNGEKTYKEAFPEQE